MRYDRNEYNRFECPGPRRVAVADRSNLGYAILICVVMLVGTTLPLWSKYFFAALYALAS